MPDGLKVDVHGNVFATGPGGVLVFAPDGTLLGRIITGVPTANVAFGEDGSTLFITANHRVLRMRTKTRGMPLPVAQTKFSHEGDLMNSRRPLIGCSPAPCIALGALAPCPLSPPTRRASWCTRAARVIATNRSPPRSKR